MRNGFHQIFPSDDDEVTGLLVADSTRLHARLDERQQLFIRHRGQFFEVAAGSAIENFVHGLSSLLNVQWSRRVIMYPCERIAATLLLLSLLYHMGAVCVGRSDC